MNKDIIRSALSEAMRRRFEELREAINTRLDEFARIPEDEYFYELCYCLLTPQSKARAADVVVKILQKRRFAENSFDPTEILASPNNYIRFHNTKARRLSAAKDQINAIRNLLSEGATPKRERDWLTANVKGLGMKEASHFLRNIGRRGLAIIDRHIIKHLNYCGIEVEAEKMGSRRYYEEVERRWLEFCDSAGITIDEMDLLFWSAETGEILK
ncbi:N-glycosylase/DNA lyase [Ignavibacteria bacterium]|jgi:N-glycosylase/DNA lyase|nr:DNA lyase [Bacteroidota bacterium]MCZ2132126.1 DNA lyase [Bacteroidota bacterium]